MAEQNLFGALDDGAEHHPINTIRPGDLMDALSKGWADFREHPTHYMMLVIIYPIVGLIMARMVAGQDLLPLLFPIVSGFALVGPIVAVGLYELSRRKERGESATIRDALNVVHSPSFPSIVYLSIVLAAVYFAWIASAQGIYVALFGSWVPESIGVLINQVLTTSEGTWLILIGGGVGFLFALFVLAIAAVSFPMLLDKPVGAVVAIQTSVRALLANPVTMLMWGVLVTSLLIVGMIPAFFGLAVVMPVLGHATWHLYRKVVEK